MNKKEKRNLLSKIEWEGGLYETFRHYGDFSEIKDKKFHELRENFINASIALEKYLGIYEIK